MKPLKISLFILAAVIMLMGCKKNVVKLLPKGTGDWNIVSQTVVLYLNESFFSDDTYLNIGTMHFNSDFTGESQIDTTNEIFTWEYDKKNDQITIVTSTEFTLFDILEFNKEAMTMFTTDSLEAFSTETKWEITTMLEKQ